MTTVQPDDSQRRGQTARDRDRLRPAQTAADCRVPEYPVNPLFPNRWSPRSMTGEPMPRDTLMSLFEAARWAPSSRNAQPWRFVYAFREGPGWDAFLDLLFPTNRIWAQRASVLVVILSHAVFERDGKPAPTHSFDTGSAWMSLALQGSLLGLAVHGMAGFDKARAREALGVPEQFAVEAMAAVGYPAPAGQLPEDLREREKPSGRKSVREFAFEGGFPRSE